MAAWNPSDMSSQAGRTAVVTGTGGLGYYDALALARAGMEVVVAGRNAEKGAATVERIRSEAPGAQVQFEALDLADLKSIAAFGAKVRRERESLDLLINNAGVMAPPKRLTTTDGFELQFGTNYLGHFVLASELLPLLRSGLDPRVVNVASIAANGGAINFDDLQAERSYKPMAVYSQSKLANLLFSFELQRRSDARGWGLSSIAAHPGISRTDLIENGVGSSSPMAVVLRFLGPVLMQSAERGALSTLYAATSPDAVPGGYYGPNGAGERRGDPAEAKVPQAARDLEVARRLWTVSEALTRTTFDGVSPPSS